MASEFSVTVAHVSLNGAPMELLTEYLLGYIPIPENSLVVMFPKEQANVSSLGHTYPSGSSHQIQHSNYVIEDNPSDANAAEAEPDTEPQPQHNSQPQPQLNPQPQPQQEPMLEPEPEPDPVEMLSICNVCFSGNVNVRTPCAHEFHKDCIIPWLSDNSECTICHADCVAEDLVAIT